jgi:hypothetical protein
MKNSGPSGGGYGSISSEPGPFVAVQVWLLFVWSKLQAFAGPLFQVLFPEHSHVVGAFVEHLCSEMAHVGKHRNVDKSVRICTLKLAIWIDFIIHALCVEDSLCSPETKTFESMSSI